MWNIIERFLENVTKYSTFVGQIWYLIFITFRMIVVATIGSSVYSDEQSAFRCSTKVIGCDNVCYNQFAKISHIRFWAFQMLALTFPIVTFYFYAVKVESKIEKLKEAEDESKRRENIVEDDKERSALKKMNDQKLRQRQKKAGKAVQRKRYNKDTRQLEVVNFNKDIYRAYFLSVIGRIVIEAVFLFLAYDLYRYDFYSETSGVITATKGIKSFWNLFLIRVPQLFRCSGPDVEWACSQHILPGSPDPYVPCWVSRAWEKTIFLCYMNTLGMICLLLSLIEVIKLINRYYRTKTKKLQKQQTLKTEYQQILSNRDDCKSGRTEMVKSVEAAPVQVSHDALYPKSPANITTPILQGSNQIDKNKIKSDREQQETQRSKAVSLRSEPAASTLPFDRKSKDKKMPRYHESGYEFVNEHRRDSFWDNARCDYKPKQFSTTNPPRNCSTLSDIQRSQREMEKSNSDLSNV